MNKGKKRNYPAPDQIVIGRRAVAELLEHNGRSVKELLIAASTQGRADSLGSLVGLAESQKIPVSSVDGEQLTAISRTDSHQSIVAVLKARTYQPLKEFLERSATLERALIVALDGVHDPHNLGAILRSAECFGASAVMWSKNRGAGVTPVVTKVSVGASEIMPLVLVSNLVQALNRCKESGFWIVGTDMGAGAESLSAFKFPEKTVLVLGGEERGVRQGAQAACDMLVTIPMLGRIASLNVAQAGAVLLAAASREQS